MQKTILIVDDDRLIRVLLERKLCSLNFNAISLSSADEALARLEEIRPDLIVSDILMPGIGGIEFCQRVRSQDAWRNVPFVFISVRRRVKDKVESLEAGADDYIQKPFHLEEFVARIEARLRINERLSATAAREESDTIKLAAQANPGDLLRDTMNETQAERIFQSGVDHFAQGRSDVALTAWAPLLEDPDPKFAHFTNLVTQHIETAVRERFGSLDAVIAKRSEALEPAAAQESAVCKDALWQTIDGVKTISEIVVACGGNRLQILGQLIHWLEAGFVKITSGFV